MSSFKLTIKQIVFLFVYPLAHTLLSVVFLFMALANGFSLDEDVRPPSPAQEIVSRIGAFGINILWQPIFIMQRMGVRYSPVAYLGYLWIFLVGIL